MTERFFPSVHQNSPEQTKHPHNALLNVDICVCAAEKNRRNFDFLHRENFRGIFHEIGVADVF